MHFRYPTDEQLRHVDIYFLATKIICSLSTLNCNLLNLLAITGNNVAVNASEPNSITARNESGTLSPHLLEGSHFSS